MAILDEIRRDWMAARKARVLVTATLLGTLIGAIETKEKTFNPARKLTDAEVIAEVKRMLDAVIDTGRHLAVATGRDEESAKNAIERGVLEEYMPQQMSEAEIEAFVVAKKADGLAMGAIMAALKADHAGAYDGRLASAIVKRVLAA